MAVSFKELNLIQVFFSTKLELVVAGTVEILNKMCEIIGGNSI